MKKVPNNFFSVILYKDYHRDGAFPQVIRQTFKVKNVHTSLKEHFSISDNCLIFGTSSFFSFFMLIRAKLKNAKVYIAPLGQLDPFLDIDNPFDFGDQFNKDGWSLSTKKGRRFDGKSSVWSLFRLLYRKIWRNIFVRLMLYFSDGVLVLSNYEGSLVKKLNPNIDLLRIEQWFYKPYSRKGIQIELPNNKLNLIYWGRVDFYYKGLDILLNSLHNLPNVNLYISGQDYRNGLEKVNKIIKSNKLKNVIFVKETICFSALKNFDFMVLPSRWEGFFRAPLDAKANGLKVLCRKSLNYDFYAVDDDILFEDDLELIKILSKYNLNTN
jgi:hypothetical protein